MPRAFLAITLLTLAAQPAWPQVLVPGKPAGTEAAQHVSYRTGFIGISIIAVALTFALPGSSTTSTASSATTS
jgi:hypothetical protein